MASPAELYVQSIYKRFKYFGTWFPNSSIQLGDVCVRQGNLFQYQTSLENLGLDYEIRRGKQPMDLMYTSASGVNISFKASGQATGVGSALPIDKAGAIVEFEDQGALVFQAARCLEHQIDDKVALGRDVVQKYQAGEWEKEWVVVDTVVVVDCATVLVSNSQNSKIELSAEKALSAYSVPLADANAGLGICMQSGDITHVLAEKRITPLFRVSRIKSAFIDWLLGHKGSATFEGVRRGTGSGKGVDLSEYTDELLEEVELM